MCLYLSQDTTITESDNYLGQWYVSSLKAGESSSATTTVTVPSSLTFRSDVLRRRRRRLPV